MHNKNQSIFSTGHRLAVRYIRGIRLMFTSPLGLFILMSYIILSVLVWKNRYNIWNEYAFTSFSKLSISLFLGLYIFIFSNVLILLIGQCVRDRIYSNRFRSIGMVNHIGDTPILLAYHCTYKTGKFYCIEIEFESSGIPLSVWRENIEELQNCFDITVTFIRTGKKSKHIIVEGMKGSLDFHIDNFWDESMLLPDDNIALGLSAGTEVSLNLNLYPHILIGGTTGSGKTWLLQHILLQCMLKKYTIIIADLKGGVDFPGIWKEYCQFVTDPKNVVTALAVLWDELIRRRELLLESECRNIQEYNSNKPEEPLKHVVFACDEVAQLLDKTGLDKDEKELCKKIEQHLNNIARLGRAFGIHLFLATQRPDADILPGQIKNNITYRICGKADDVLSRIVLDNSNAADQIPHDAQGVFINQDQIVFKGYVYNGAIFN